jgi:uncharacterized repeat protein (TIGR03803 family)
MFRVTLKLSSLLVVAMVLCLAILVTPARAQTETIIYSFAGGTDGGSPQGGVIADTVGNLYGVTEYGGAIGGGAIFELTPASGGGWTKKTLYSFNYSGGDVYLPVSNLVFDAKGNLCGVAPIGGASGFGGVFELSPTANNTWTEKVIYSFAGGTDITSFQATLTIDGAGNLYFYRPISVSSTGTYSYGGVVELQASSGWSEKVVFTFTGGNDGSAPYGGQLTLDASGNLYGMAYNGAHDFGLVFKLVKGSNGTFTEKILHTFSGGTDGSAGAAAPLTVTASGNVFGVSQWNLFELIPNANGTWTEKILHAFNGGTDGAYPQSGLTMDASGRLYGTTDLGGVHHGTVYQVTQGSNGAWTEKVLHKFTATAGDGLSPNFETLSIDSKGNLYGTTSSGGINGNGVVFEVTP